MPPARHGRIVVDLEVDDGDALEGTVALEGGETSAFRGWIGLFSALEGSVGRVRDGRADDAGGGRPPAGGT